MKPMARTQAVNPKITFWRIFRYKRFLQADKMRCGPAHQPENRECQSSSCHQVIFATLLAVKKIILGALMGEALPYRAKSGAPKFP